MLKKICAVFFTIVILFLMPFSVFAEGITYTDPETKVSFTIPNDWKEIPLGEEREIIKVKYTHNTEDGSTIMFGYGDMWGQLTEDERDGYTRDDLNHDLMCEVFSNEEIAELLGMDTESSIIEEESYNWKEYVKITSTSQIDIANYSTNVTLTYLIHIQEGYMFMFSYGYMGENIHGQDFDELMKNVKYSDIYTFTHEGEEIIIPNVDDLPSLDVPSYITDIEDNDYVNDYDTTESDGGIIYYDDGELKFDFIGFILSLLVTIIVYSLPIIVYRYAIKKQPLPEKKAKKIVIIYGIIAFFIMAILTGGHVGAAIILWSTINYKMLTKSSKNDVYDDTPHNDALNDESRSSVNSITKMEENTQTTSEQIVEEAQVNLEPKHIVEDTYAEKDEQSIVEN